MEISLRALMSHPYDKSMYRKIQICDIYIVIILVLFDVNLVTNLCLLYITSFVLTLPKYACIMPLILPE